MKASIKDIAYAFPSGIETNDDLLKENPEWNIEKLYNYSGVSQRYIAAPDETALDLAEQACIKLFSKHTQLKQVIDVVIFCTNCQDHWVPSNACILHGRLDLDEQVSAIDINMACSGYIYGLELARNYLLSKTAKNILLITSDTYSKFIHPNDRATRILFGDGAAVTWLTSNEAGSGIIDIQCGTQGKGYTAGIIPAGASRMPASEETAIEFKDNSGNLRTQNHLHLNGIRLFQFVKSKIPKAVQSILEKHNLSTEDIHTYVFHQASRGILQSISKLLDLKEGQMLDTLEDIGNTVSSSIPIALAIGNERGQIKTGDKLLLVGYGLGLSWGITLLDY